MSATRSRSCGSGSPGEGYTWACLGGYDIAVRARQPGRFEHTVFVHLGASVCHEYPLLSNSPRKKSKSICFDRRRFQSHELMLYLSYAPCGTDLFPCFRLVSRRDMVAVRHLKNAPITEALLDFRVQPKRGLPFPVIELNRLAQEIEDAYPKIEQKQLRKLEMELSPTGMSTRTEEHGIQAYWFRTERDDRIAQFRIDGFTYNMLKPYENWESMQTEALKLWCHYETIMQPQAILRLGARFINHVNLEMPVK